MVSPTLIKVSLLKGRFKRTSWMFSLAAVVLFFALPVATALYCIGASFERSSPIYADYPELLIKDLAFAIETHGNAVVGITVFFAVLFALATWNYLNSKRQVDFYHALPYKRLTLFNSFYLAGACSYIIPYVIMFALSSAMLVVVTGVSVFHSVIMAITIDVFITNLLIFLSVYTIATLACMLCGNLFVAFMGTAVFLAFPPLTVALLAYSIYLVFSTFPMWEYTWEAMLGYTSPIYAFLSGDHTLYFIVVTALLFVLSAYLYQKRPSEAAGNAMAFDKSRDIIKYPIVLIITLGIGYLFNGMDSSSGSMIFGFVSGALLANAIVEIIYDFNVKSAFKNLKGIVAYGILFTAISSFLAFDVIGFDDRLPSDGLSGVSVKVSNFTQISNMAGKLTDDNRFPLAYDDGAFLDSFVFEDQEMLDLAKRMAQSGVDSALYGNYGNRAQMVFYEGSDRYAREYVVSHELIEEFVITAYNNDDFRSQILFGKLFDSEITNIDEIDEVIIFDEVRNIRDVGRYNDEDFIKELIEALKEDTLNMSSDILISEAPFISIEFDLYHYRDLSVPIYSTYDKTLAVLARHDVTIPSPVTAEEISSIDVHILKEGQSSYESEIIVTYEFGGSYETYDSAELSDVIEVTDPEEIATLLTLIKPADYNLNLDLFEYTQGYDITVNFKDESGGSSKSYTIIPEFEGLISVGMKASSEAQSI